MSLLFREATLTDVPALIAIEEKSFTTDKISPKQMRYLLTRGQTHTLVATSHDKVIAYCMFLLRSHIGVSRLYSIAVSEDFQKQGIAKQLLNESLTHFKKNQYRYCTLEVRESHEHTRKLYESFGFVTTKRIEQYYQDKESALRMKFVL